MAAACSLREPEIVSASAAPFRASSHECFVCFDAVAESLHSPLAKGVRPMREGAPSDAAFFVTWTSGNDRLRGCLGTMRPVAFEPGLADMAVKAASKDSRFAPVPLADLPTVTCGVSILSPMMPCSAWDDWDVGVHGIVLQWRDYSATYLPEVALEQHWNKREAVESLAHKAGFTLEDKHLSEIKVKKYTSSKAKATFGATLLSNARAAYTRFSKL